jgi:hypothetical protein
MTEESSLLKIPSTSASKKLTLRLELQLMRKSNTALTNTVTKSVLIPLPSRPSTTMIHAKSG